MSAIRLVQQRLSTIATIVIALGSFSPIALRAEDPPDAREILKSARVAQAAQNRMLEGQLRTGPKKVPFRLSMKDSVIRWDFFNPPQTLLLRLGETSSSLEEITPDGKQKIGGKRLDDPVRDSDITYEDLAFHFLYWKNAKVEGEQTVKFTKCWQVLAMAPGGGVSSYGSVRLWIAKDSGALMKAEAYGRDGKLMRAFTVISGQKDDEGLWILKSMRIETTTSRSGGDRTPTYLEINRVGK
jgi:hypothetical protein